MKVLDLDRLARVAGSVETVRVTGRVVRAVGIVVEASLPRVPVGTSCEIRGHDGRAIQSEVIGFTGGLALLLPFGDLRGVGEGCEVIPGSRAADIPVGPALLGRVVDPSMRPADGGPPLVLTDRAPIDANPPAAMVRRRIADVLPTGVRALDAFLTLGEGQRIGIMAGPGVGKSVLMGMLARSAAAEVIVVGLVGERGREVREFVERDLGPGLAKSVVVVATSDEPPLVRLRAAMAATSIAEYFRDQGKRVMLLIDSLSRTCMAQREIGLAAGEPPTSKGYPPSVFAMLPRLVERAGLGGGRGSVTALYTVLAEGDDLSDPVVDASRAALDGHVVLSRRLASGGHFPAIDVLPSVSRVMSEVVSPQHLRVSQDARELLATYRDAQDLVEVGAYVAGSNPRVDRALRAHAPLIQFLRQAPNDRTPLPQTLASLDRIVVDSQRR